MQKKENFVSDNPDWQFHFQNKLDFATYFELTVQEEREALGASTGDEYRQIWVDMLNQLGEIVGSSIAPNQRKVASEDVLLKDGEVIFPQVTLDNLETLKAIGLPAVGIRSSLGGLPSPFGVDVSSVELLYRACPSTYLNVTWYSPIARIIAEFGNDAQKEKYIPRIAGGEWSGNMALTEPDAGSDLGNLKTYGEKQADGSWKLFGTKRFISNGPGQVSLVLAKGSKGAQGLKALNLYLCLRKFDDGTHNIKVTKLEEKVGLHGSATCDLNYDGSHAELIGEEGKGFNYMLHLMNEARIAVAFQSLGIMESVLRIAKDYTSQRHSWGRPIAQHELLVEKLLDLEVSTYAIRSLCFQAGNSLSIHNLAAQRLEEDKTLTDEQRATYKSLKNRHMRRVRRWTPLVKYYAAEQAIHNARQCMQMHGGYGYTLEYLPEWWLRESLIVPVYEGTSQIQALMCLKDTMKDIIRKPAKFIESALGSKVRVLSERRPLKRKLNKLRDEYNAALMAMIFRLVKENMRTSFSEVSPKDIRKIIKILTQDLVKFENLRPALLHAERITEIKSMVCMAESLYADAKIDASRSWILERWLNKSIPRAAMLHAEIEMDDPVLAKRLDAIPLSNMGAQMS